MDTMTTQKKKVKCVEREDLEYFVGISKPSTERVWNIQA
jgi:hypothetical protein